MFSVGETGPVSTADTPADAPATHEREHDVALPTHTARVLEWGPADGPLALALHGFPDTAHTWRRVAPILASAGYRVAAPFTRGYAPSGLPSDDDWSVQGRVDDALALHAALGGDERTVLVGHDWGAITANAVAGLADQPFAHVVSISVPPFSAVLPRRDVLSTWLGALAGQPLRSWYIGLASVPGVPDRLLHRLVPLLWHRWSPGYDAGDDVAHVRDATPDAARARAVLSYYRHLVRHGPGPAAAAPRRPLLYLHGARDGCIDRRFALVATGALPEGSRVEVVPGAGHFVPLEQPAAVARAVLAFVEGGARGACH